LAARASPAALAGSVAQADLVAQVAARRRLVRHKAAVAGPGPASVAAGAGKPRRVPRKAGRAGNRLVLHKAGLAGRRAPVAQEAARLALVPLKGLAVGQRQARPEEVAGAAPLPMAPEVAVATTTGAATTAAARAVAEVAAVVAVAGAAEAVGAEGPVQ
jgi:hypothetical protein